MNDRQKLMVSALFSVSTLIALPASAFPLDDFEDGNYNGWLETTVAGGRVYGGSYGVEVHNGSNMAFSYHYGPGSNALSIDLTYSPAEVVSFDMHAVAVSVVAYFGSTLNARSGVTIAFLNQINIPLGATGLYDVTDPSWLPAGSYEIDSTQHNYSGTMAFFASLAGLDPANSLIAKMSLSFQVAGESEWGGNIYPDSASYGTVWFDNVVAPEPDSHHLFALAGLAMVTVVRRRSSKS